MSTWLNYVQDIQFMPHGMCFLWRPDLLFLHAGSDLLIALSYYSIPLALLMLWRRRPNLEFGWMFKLFALFIVACGTTHLITIWNIWNGQYYLEGFIKLVTAAVSAVTAVMLWPLIPKFLEIPSPLTLAQQNEALNEEMALRHRAEQEIFALNESLEQTVAKRTEELEKAKNALESEVRAANRMRQRLESIFESAPNGMIVVSPSGEILQSNATANNIFRYDDLIGRSVEELVPRNDRPDHRLRRAHYSATPVKRMMGDRQDLFGLRQDGTAVPVEIGLNPVSGSEGREIIASIVDVSERRRYEQRIKQHNAALERSNKELEEFAFIASHDLREPLRKIISFSRLLMSEDYGNFTEEGEEFTHYIVGAAERMRELLDSLLSYSRVTSHGRTFTETNLADLVEQIEADLQLTIEETQATLIVGELGTLDADSSQLRQLLQNLISNALKYRHKERAPEVQIEGESLSTDRYRITISDNGIGFDPRYNEQIFEVFKRLHGRSEYPGTGMGLAICRKIVDRHGGTIIASGRDQEGAVFVIELPIRQQPVEASNDG
ncbi:sensor histidine kinase [Saccharospirillum mangrovi]|uniref:sensor histidine kinase n=1 Tax=Saccharospirillum mangrovi TaxID=2161747 RepID=UPI000D3B4D61|nr:ATP-binding protein [Saccharospirillum mangrovi]